ncbi:hypothetical protein BS78_05G066400 [Paspalum vaginatum]|nr:hypothetical protein BS78_05G066400 [Paspalum vaginatum]
MSRSMPLALFLLTYSLQHNLSGVIIKQDKNGCNVLHHAIRSRLTELAIKFIEAMPVLSKAVNKYDESPMFIAVMRDIPDVVNRLLQVPDSAHGGSSGYNALHAAVRNDNQGIAQMLVRERPELAREETCQMMTPMEFAALENKIGVLRVLLQHDYSLGFVISTSGRPLLNVAARRGHDGIAKELLECCPDAPYLDTCDGMTCLHEAVTKGQQDFVEFVLQSKQLRKLINMRDKDGDTALHCAIRNCNPKIVAALLRHQDTDLTILSNKGNPAVWLSSDGVDQAKTLNWNEVCSLMLNADPKDEGEIRNVYKEVKDGLIEKSRSDIRSLTQTYTNNTSLIAILIATITFAAAFTLPGGYSSDSGSEGLPIMARKLAFQAFLISNTLAMCSSLCVAFICIIARWEDLEFLVYYRRLTKKIMWFAYMATTTAFATGLYTILAPRVPWLAIFICAVSFLLPFFTKVVGEWPTLRFKLLIAKSYRAEIIDDFV